MNGLLTAIVRGADTNRHDLTPQSAGLLAISMGLRDLTPDDQEVLWHGFVKASRRPKPGMRAALMIWSASVLISAASARAASGWRRRGLRLRPVPWTWAAWRPALARA